MTEWRVFLTKNESRVESFRTKKLSYANFTFAGSTDKASLTSKRYENYRKISWNPYINLELLYQGNIIATEYEQDVQTELYTKDIINKKLEEWNLTYFQINFESQREEIETEVAKLFGSIRRVIKIYSSQYEEDALHFQILTENSKYDAALMERLLSIEYEIGHKYKSIYISFNYIPKIYKSELEVIVKEARLIYQKSLLGIQNEFVISSFAASSPQQTVGKYNIPVSVTV